MPLLTDSLLVTAGDHGAGNGAVLGSAHPHYAAVRADEGMMALGCPVAHAAHCKPWLLASTLGTVLAGGFEALGKGMDSLLIT